MTTQALKPGQSITFWHQKGWRPGRVLAVIDDRALVEYEMPEGTTSLTFFDVEVCPYSEHPCPNAIKGETYRNPKGYERLPLRWLQAIVASGQEWIGRSQTGVLPSAKDLLRSRAANNDFRKGWINYNNYHEREFREKIICIQDEIWGWTILIDGDILGSLRKGICSLDMAKSISTRIVSMLSQEEV